MGRRPRRLALGSTLLKASSDRVWRAITDGVETEQYYFGTRVSSDWSKGSRIVYEYPDGSAAAAAASQPKATTR